MPISLDDLGINSDVAFDASELTNAINAKIDQADSDAYVRGLEAALAILTAVPPPADFNAAVIAIQALL